jgi:hypothetical protein
MPDRLETDILVHGTPAKVYAFLCVPANHAKFIPGMFEFEQTSPGAFGRRGATARGRRRWLGRLVDLPYEITICDPGRELGMKGVLGPIAFEDGYLLNAQGKDTRVTFWLRFKPAGAVLLVMPLLLAWGKIHAIETLRNVRKLYQAAA